MKQFKLNKNIFYKIPPKRLSDFQVHEIEPTANRVVYLNNFDLPLTKQACKPEVDPNLV
jgi:hypothetical protein